MLVAKTQEISFNKKRAASTNVLRKWKATNAPAIDHGGMRLKCFQGYFEKKRGSKSLVSLRKEALVSSKQTR